MISLNNIIKTKNIQISKNDKINFKEIKDNINIYPSYYYTQQIYYSNYYNTDENIIIFLCGYKNVGQTFILNEKSLIFWPYYSFYIINKDFNYKYIYYCLKFIDYNKLLQLNTNRKDVILLKDIKNIEIPNLSLNEQNDIINIFENFENKFLKLEELNKYFNNFNIFNYFKKNKINTIDEILNLEYSLLQNKFISNTLILSSLNNIFDNLNFNNDFILLKNIFDLYYSNQIINDNKNHLCLNYIDNLNYLQIKYINYNIPLKNNIILFFNKNKNNFLDEFIFYYLLIKKYKLLKTKINNIFQINLLYNFKIPNINLIKQKDLINSIHNNLLSIYNNIDFNFNLLSIRLNKFLNNSINHIFFDDNNLFFDLKLTFSNFLIINNKLSSNHFNDDFDFDIILNNHIKQNIKPIKSKKTIKSIINNKFDIIDNDDNIIDEDNDYNINEDNDDNIIDEDDIDDNIIDENDENENEEYNIDNYNDDNIINDDNDEDNIIEE